MISYVALVSPQDILIRRVSGQYAKYIWRQFSLPILRNLSIYAGVYIKTKPPRQGHLGK